MVATQKVVTRVPGRMHRIPRRNRGRVFPVSIHDVDLRGGHGRGVETPVDIDPRTSAIPGKSISAELDAMAIRRLHRDW